MQPTWESIWPSLLNRAACLAESAQLGPKSEFTASISAIVLARTAWEAFLNEFVVWRSITKPKRHMSTHDLLKCSLVGLGLEEKLIIQEQHWRNHLLLNQIRNALVHHAANVFDPPTSPNNILHKVHEIGVLAELRTDQTWERQLAKFEVADWCCKWVAHGIIALEQVPAHRHRSSDITLSSVEQAMHPLAKLHYGTRL